MRQTRYHGGNILLWFLLVIVGSSSVIAQDKDYWLKIERQGVGFGYNHITVRPIEDGFLCYDFNQHLKMDVAGFNPQDLETVGTLIVDGNLMPISLMLQTQSPAKNEKISGKVVNGQLVVTIQNDSLEMRQIELPFRETYFDVVLADLIIARRQEPRWAVKLLNSKEFKIDEFTIVINDTSANEITAAIGDEMTCRIDSSGRLQQLEFPSLKIREFLTDAANAQNITYLKTADGLTGSVKSQQSFPNIYRVTRAQLQLKWRGVPFNEFNFIDNRQKLVKTTVANDEFEAVLEITRAKPITKKIRLPFEDEWLNAFLGEDNYIQPDNYDIRQMAATIQGSDMDAVVVVQNILKWISQNITTDFYAETLTGAQVLKKRRGKCSEYAILFASLARAAGIPNKIVLGEANNGNEWIGHMWNEVWLGEWIAVDATAGFFISGPTHVKFFDSPTLAGIQKIRTKLVDNLSLEILNYDEETGAANITTGIHEQTYSNADYHCQISSPDTSWTISSSVENGRIEITMLPKREEGVKFALTLFAVPTGTLAKTILTRRLQTLAGMLKDFQILAEGEAQVTGQSVPRVLFQSEFQEQGHPPIILVSENQLLVQGNNAYLFKAICPQDQFAAVKENFRKILASFVLLR